MCIQHCGFAASQDVTHYVQSWRNDALTFHSAELYTMGLKSIVCAHDLTGVLLGTMLSPFTYCRSSFTDSTIMQHHAGTIRYAAAQSIWLV